VLRPGHVVGLFDARCTYVRVCVCARNSEDNVFGQNAWPPLAVAETNQASHSPVLLSRRPRLNVPYLIQCRLLLRIIIGAPSCWPPSPFSCPPDVCPAPSAPNSNTPRTWIRTGRTSRQVAGHGRPSYATDGPQITGVCRRRTRRTARTFPTKSQVGHGVSGAFRFSERYNRRNAATRNRVRTRRRTR